MYYPKELEKNLNKSSMKKKIGKIFQSKKKKRSMDILLNWQDILIKRKNIVIMTVMILIAME